MCIRDRVLAALRDAGGLLAVHCENHAITRFLGDKLRREAPRDPMSHPRSRPARCLSLIHISPYLLGPRARYASRTQDADQLP